MATTFSTWVGLWYDQFKAAATDIGGSTQDLVNAQQHWDLAQDHDCLQDLLFWAWHVDNSLQKFFETYTYPFPRYRMFKLYTMMWEYDYEEMPGAEVTMSAIINAMLTADFDELKSFVGIADAYRVSLWNKPFEVEFYAALARGFLE